MNDMNIFSFFSGVGMLDLGFQDAGYEVVFVNEFKQEFMTSYRYARRNQNYLPPRYGYYVGDINYFLSDAGETIFQQYIDNERQNGELIGFIGGPPCPDFSVGGKNRGRAVHQRGHRPVPSEKAVQRRQCDQQNGLY